MPKTGMVCGRLAPSPTGFLHLGNAWSFWVAWLAARSARGRLVLRLEDIDPARSKPEYADALLRDLAWLGLDWDPPEQPADCLSADGIYTQSRCHFFYQAALDDLRRAGRVYPCYCTRKELRTIAGAPHVDDAGAPYPGTCRSLSAEERAEYERAGRRFSWRLMCPPDHAWVFTDALMGPQRFTLAECGGDFALCRSDGVFAYQLAVVVDDIRMSVTQVVRGADILVSTPRQLYLYSLFGAKPPEYAHVPLVVDASGERLAKRHASLTLESLREAGIRSETLLGWFAGASGLRPNASPLTAGECLSGFSFAVIRPQPLRLPDDPLSFFLRLQQQAAK